MNERDKVKALLLLILLAIILIILPLLSVDGKQPSEAHLQRIAMVDDEAGAEIGVLWRWPERGCVLAKHDGGVEALPCPE